MIWLVFTGVLSEAGKKIDFLQTFFLTSVGCMCYVAIQAGASLGETETNNQLEIKK